MNWSSLLVVATLSACLSVSHAKPTNTWAELEQQIAAQLTQENAFTRYHAHKANMWLTYAKNEASEGSLTVAGKEALAQTQALLSAIQQPTEVSLTTPILSVSQVMRRDLWWQIEYLKQHGAVEAAPQALAEAEVMLVWAAAEYCELGWRHAREHFLAVERKLNQVMQTVPNLQQPSSDWPEAKLPSLEALNAQGCVGVNQDLWPLHVPQAIVVEPTPMPQSVLLNRLMIENVVHFALDRTALNAEGQNVLDQIATLLAEYPDLHITLMGYTDARASVAYNLRLSQRRIDRVRNYLVSKGVTANRIAEQAKGEEDLMNDAESRIAHAKSRRVVVYFHDIEGHSIEVQPQWRDLQLEPVAAKGVNKDE